MHDAKPMLEFSPVLHLARHLRSSRSRRSSSPEICRRRGAKTVNH